jgi:hypothetical protein
MGSVRQLFSRVFDVALGAAAALLLIGSAGLDRSAEPRAAKGPIAIPVAEAYSAEVVEPLPSIIALLDPKAEYLSTLVARGRHWRVDTDRGPVHVWAPAGYRAETAHTVLYVHGYWADADAAWHEHRLAEQFAMSGANALFVVPEAPRGKWDPVVWPSAQALLRDVATRIGEPLPKGRLDVVGHSGAYRTVIQWLADPRIDTVALLDAAYVDVLPYRNWVIGSKSRRFINVSIDTIRWSDRLHRWLPSTLTVEPFPRAITDELRAARIVYIKSDIGHFPLVTEGVALPAIVRALDAPTVVDGDPPPLGLPELPPPALQLRETEVAKSSGEIPD